MRTEKAKRLQDSPHRKKKTCTTSQRYSLFAIFYGALVGVLTLGHQMWLLIIHHQCLKEFGKSTHHVFMDAIPAYVPFIILLIGATIVVTYKDEGMPKLDLFIMPLVPAMFIGMFTHYIQGIIIMIREVVYYLEYLPDVATCFCYPNTKPSLLLANMSVNGTYRCKCRVPYEEENIHLIVSDPSMINQTLLQDYGYDCVGDPKIFNGSSIDEATNYPGFKIFNSMQLLILLIQMCLIFYVMRCPLWVSLRQRGIIRKIEQLKKEKEMDDENEETLMDDFENENQTSTAKKNWIKAFSYVKKAGDKAKRILTLQRMQAENTQSFIECTYCGFTEGLDAFTLLDEVFDNGNYFKANPTLTHAILAFIAINLLLIILVDAISFLPIITENEIDHEKIAAWTKITVVLINNVPFLVIRIYLFWLYGIETEDGIDKVLLLFIMKEASVIVLGIAELMSSLKKQSLL